MASNFAAEKMRNKGLTNCSGLPTIEKQEEPTMDQNKRIFKNYATAMLRADEIATETNKIMVVGMHCDTRLFHIMEKDSPELYDTTPCEMDGETVDCETYINCINVHPNK
jgi:hypothetical protein